MRAKFRCDKITDWGTQKQAELIAVTTGSNENQDFNQYTPAGVMTITIDKEGAMNYFTPGKEYYLDFTEVS